MVPSCKAPNIHSISGIDYKDLGREGMFFCFSDIKAGINSNN